MTDTQAQASAPPAEELPKMGGSYIRHEDGSLERTGGTEPAQNAAATLPTALATATTTQE